MSAFVPPSADLSDEHAKAIATFDGLRTFSAAASLPVSPVTRRQFIAPAAAAVLSACMSNGRAQERVVVRTDPIVSRRTGAGALLPYRPEHLAAVRALIEEAYPRDHILHTVISGLHLPPAESPSGRWRTTFVATADRRVIGVGSAIALNMHDVAFINVIVEPREQRRGIGRRIFDHLREAAAGVGMPMLTNVLLEEPVAYEFARACGMSILMRSRQRFVDPGSWAVLPWCARARDANHGYRLRSGNDVDNNLLIDALGLAYEMAHRNWIPVKKLAHTDWSRAWGSMIVSGSGVLAMDDEQVVGMGCLLKVPARQNELAISPLGACLPMPSAARELALSAHLMAECLLTARAAGHRRLLIERDDGHDGRLVPLFADIPLIGLHEGYSLAFGLPSHWPRPYKRL